jgi:hypothetical protein
VEYESSTERRLTISNIPVSTKKERCAINVLPRFVTGRDKDEMWELRRRDCGLVVVLWNIHRTARSGSRSSPGSIRAAGPW